MFVCKKSLGIAMLLLFSLRTPPSHEFKKNIVIKNSKYHFMCLIQYRIFRLLKKTSLKYIKYF